jgi:membrane protease YdiL (CAAX protease family)
VPETQRTSRPPAGPILLAFAAAFLLTQAADQGLVLAVARARSGGHEARIADEAAAFVGSMAGMSAIPVLNGLLLASLALALATAQSLRSGAGPIQRLGLGRSASTLRGAAAATLGVLGLSVACGALIQLLGVHSGDTMDRMEDAFRSRTSMQLLVAVVAVGIVPGVAEEIFFRGFMLEGLVESWGPWPAIVGSSAAFGLIHVEPVQASGAFVVGLFLGWCARRLGSIRPTMFAHAANNTAFLVLAAWGAGGGASRTRAFVDLGAGAVVCAGSIAWLLRTERAGAVRASTPAS